MRVDRYLGALATGDAAAVAAVYAPNATRRDDVLGVHATGRAEIASALAGARTSVKVVGVYVQTNGPSAIAGSDLGQIVSLGIRYQAAAVVNGVARTDEAVAVLDLGAVRVRGYDLDVARLIHTETVYHAVPGVLDR